jgi:hypothetical protein
MGGWKSGRIRDQETERLRKGEKRIEGKSKRLREGKKGTGSGECRYDHIGILMFTNQEAFLEKRSIH